MPNSKVSLQKKTKLSISRDLHLVSQLDPRRKRGQLLAAKPFHFFFYFPRSCGGWCGGLSFHRLCQLIRSIADAVHLLLPRHVVMLLVCCVEQARGNFCVRYKHLFKYSRRFLIGRSMLSPPAEEKTRIVGRRPMIV